jgi:hypothetical protein
MPRNETARLVWRIDISLRALQYARAFLKSLTMAPLSIEGIGVKVFGEARLVLRVGDMRGDERLSIPWFLHVCQGVEEKPPFWMLSFPDRSGKMARSSLSASFDFTTAWIQILLSLSGL